MVSGSNLKSASLLQSFQKLIDFSYIQLKTKIKCKLNQTKPLLTKLKLDVVK